MAGMTSWIISNLLSSIEKLSQFMHPFPSIPASSSSSSSSIVGDGTTSDVHSIQEKLMEDLSRLSRMLRRIQAVLHDAEEREIYDKSIQLWLSELREVAYDAEDVLDKYDYQVIKTQVEGMIVAAEAEHSLKKKQADDVDDDDLYDFQVSLSSSTLTKIPISCNMAKRVMKIIEKFDEIAKDREALQLREEDGIRLSTFDDAMKRPLSSSLVNDYDIFGREDDKKKIIHLLKSNSEKVNTVIAIVGLGGVGKTTLAQLVYNDHSICEHFSLKVWVCVSEEFDVLRVTKEILKSINKSSGLHDNNNLNDLQCMLKEALLEKRFLLILDDVWNERPDMWEALYAPFSGVGMGKIIVTTRSMWVARIMQTVPPHVLGCLDNEKSWLLLQRHAFCGWELDQQLNFEHIGREITKKCGGLPLALKAIGGFLRYEVEEQIWNDVLNNNLWELEETKNLILPALRISYNHLPAHLKPCFVYASLFPKDQVFGKDEMIGMWMAQGYIQLTKRKRLMEDIAFEYFEDLHRRSFFQCSIYSERFTLHDMVHDLARSIARNEIYSSLNYDELKDIHKDTKHIFLKHTSVEHLRPLFEAIRTFYGVRKWTRQYNLQGCFCNDSFALFGCLRVLNLDAMHLVCNLQIVDFIGNLHQLRYLRINVSSLQLAKYSLCNLYKLQTLKLRSLDLNMLPSAMNKLINLRHLVIHCYNFEKLPKSICRIENLLTLDIKYMFVRRLPLGISKLTNLRHLMLPNVDNFYIPCEIERMISLQTLSTYHILRFGEYSSIGCLKHLMNLRGSLKIYNLENVVSCEDAMSANLQSKPYIECLHLSWTYSIEVYEYNSLQEAVLDGLQPHTNLKELIIYGYGGNSFPRWFGNSHLSNLTKISLVNFKNNKECKFLPFSGLPSLRSLELNNIKGLRRMEQDFWCYNAPPVDHDRENNFEEVHVANKNMPKWKKCPTVKHGDFSSLKCLTILKCQELKQLSTLPSSLEEFMIKECRKLEYLALNDSFGPLSRLQKLTVSHCDNLKSMKSLNNLLVNIKFLNLYACQQLQLDPDEYSDRTFATVSLEIAFVRICYCPGMKDWCRWHGFPYSQTASWNPFE